MKTVQYSVYFLFFGQLFSRFHDFGCNWRVFGRVEKAGGKRGEEKGLSERLLHTWMGEIEIRRQSVCLAFGRSEKNRVLEDGIRFLTGFLYPGYLYRTQILFFR